MAENNEKYLEHALRFLKSDELAEFVADKKNRDIMAEVIGLTEWKLRDDLAKAVKYKKGYYKNAKGQCIYVKGIEVTNDTSNLLRMGYNGEDRGVWVHYCIADERTVSYNDVPVNTFAFFLNEGCVPQDEVFKPSTKEEFERTVARAVANFTSDYEEKRNVEEYVDFFGKLDEIYEKTKPEE